MADPLTEILPKKSFTDRICGLFEARLNKEPTMKTTFLSVSSIFAFGLSAFIKLIPLKEREIMRESNENA